ncbi:glycosyltransferase [Kallotenue papyrolyticum]|uniref:glycosyltransferase n=1 Tax=Kallotenue papyrolyticum TaxID=1325125 RepID=UPI000478559F|nr:glycosyltransferase [Kallotenue papyrolyticum]
MRVLLITPYVPSPIRVRPYELLRALTTAGLQPTLLCAAAPDDAPAVDHLRQLGCVTHAVPVAPHQRLTATVAGALRGLPLQAAYGAVAPLARRLRDLLAREAFALVHIEHLRAAALRPLIRDLPVVYDAVDCISLLLDRTRRINPDRRKRFMATVELGRTRRFERRICASVAAVAVTSSEDAHALRSLAPDATIHVVPNGVDLDRFAPPTTPREPNVIVFSGKMSYHANIAAALRLIDGIMPRVWAQRPATQVWIVGSNPPRSLMSRGSDPRVVITGRVPEIATYLQRATIAVSPLRYGVGVQNKVLEAMATATPVIADRQSIAALAAVPGRDLLVADDDGQFADLALALLDNATLRTSIGRAGRAYVECAHRWTSSAAQLIELYRHVQHQPGTPRCADTFLAAAEGESA